MLSSATYLFQLIIAVRLPCRQAMSLMEHSHITEMELILFLRQFDVRRRTCTSTALADDEYSYAFTMDV